MNNHKKLTEKSSNWLLFYLSNKLFYLSNILLDHKKEFFKFYMVGFSGLIINYFISYYMFTLFGFTHLYSSIIGILFSLSSNFLLNKFWTFQDMNIDLRIIVKQYLKYFLFNSVGIFIQLLVVYGFGTAGLEYGWTIIYAIIIASMINYIFNKKFIFKNNKSEFLNLKNKIN